MKQKIEVDFITLSTLFIGRFNVRKFRSHFNLLPEVVSEVWSRICTADCIRPVHLLYALYFLNVYPTNIRGGTFFKVHPDIFIKYSKLVIIYLNQNLQNFPWNERHITSIGRVMGIVDVTRCRIQKTTLKDERTFYSAKDKFHALKYEVVVSAQKPYSILWVNGPFPGSTHDIMIARVKLVGKLGNEVLLADLGYLGEDCFLTPIKEASTSDERAINLRMHKLRQAVERANKRLKDWDVNGVLWRSSDHAFHGTCFLTVSKLVQFNFRFEPL